MNGNHTCLGDFGLAQLSRPLNNNCDATSPSVEQIDSRETGTFIYTSNETYQTQKWTNKSDIYSLGLLIFELFYQFGTAMERVLVYYWLI